MINNLLLLFVWCFDLFCYIYVWYFYSLGQQCYMLDLLQLQEPGVNTAVIAAQQTSGFLSQWKLLAGPDGCRKLIFKSCSTLSTSLTTSIYHFVSYLHATYLFRRRDPVVILPKHASPVMLNEPASASSSAVRLYALEFTGLKNGNFLFLVWPKANLFFSTQVKLLSLSP